MLQHAGAYRSYPYARRYYGGPATTWLWAGYYSGYGPGYGYYGGPRVGGVGRSASVFGNPQSSCNDLFDPPGQNRRVRDVWVVADFAFRETLGRLLRLCPCYQQRTNVVWPVVRGNSGHHRFPVADFC